MYKILFITLFYSFNSFAIGGKLACLKKTLAEKTGQVVDSVSDAKNSAVDAVSDQVKQISEVEVSSKVKDLKNRASVIMDQIAENSKTAANNSGVVTQIGGIILSQPIKMERRHISEFRYKHLGKNIFSNKIGFQLEQLFNSEDLRSFCTAG